MASRTKRAQTWSYIAGTKGLNRVRVYEDGPGGDLLIEWHEPVVGADGGPVIDGTTGRPAKRRVRQSLTAKGVTSCAEAVDKAKQMAALIQQHGTPGVPDAGGDRQEEIDRDPGTPLTLGYLLDLFLKEVTPTRDEDTQGGHRSTAKMFLAYFGRDAVVERVGKRGRPETELGYVRFHGWMKARQEGTIPGFRHPARPQTIVQNVRFMRSVFRWARRERPDGTVLMMRDPWDGFETPVEDHPVRPEMTQELHQVLVENAPNWRMAVALELCRETRRRIGSVRSLAVADIDLSECTVTWHRKFQKKRKTTTTVLSGRAVSAIRLALEHRLREGVADSPWLLPASKNPSERVSASSMTTWMRRARERCGIGVPRLGYHGEKRAGIRDPRFRELKVEVREALADTTWETMKRVYDFIDLPTIREAVAYLEGDSPQPDEPKPIRRLQEAA